MENMVKGIHAEQIGETYFLIGLINRFNNSFQAVADVLFEELSWKQIFFMNCVALFDEAPNIKDMANLLGCSHQNAKQLLSKLEASGYVQVQPDPQDKRAQRMALTKKAIRFREQYETVSDQAMRQLFAGISDDHVQSMIQTCIKLIENIEGIKGEEYEDNRGV